jgi:hypothetical protein
MSDSSVWMWKHGRQFPIEMNEVELVNLLHVYQIIHIYIEVYFANVT